MVRESSDLEKTIARSRLSRRQFLSGTLGLGLSGSLASSLLLGGAKTSPAAPAPKQAPPAAKPDANALDRLVEGAKKEGEVWVIEPTNIAPAIESIKQGYRKKYGFPATFKVNLTVQASGLVVTAISTEVKARRVTNDVFWLAGVDLFRNLKQANELMAYVPREWASVYQANADKLGFETDLPYYYAPWFHNQQPMWNADKIKKTIVSYQDILQLAPEVKGKVGVGDIRISQSYLDTYVGLRSLLDVGYFKNVKQKCNPQLFGRVDEALQKMASGELDMATTVSPGQAYDRWKADRGLNWIVANPKEGIVPIAGYMAILAKAPHPNAAKLMVDYLLSKEAMQDWVTYTAQYPLRTDYVIGGDLKKFMFKFEEVKWISVDWKKVTNEQRAQLKEEWRQIYAP
jgi:iron(III) transport system substrate-binding protein